MSWESYLRLSQWDRWALHEELGDMISAVDGDGDGDEGSGGTMRPKHWRK